MKALHKSTAGEWVDLPWMRRFDPVARPMMVKPMLLLAKLLLKSSPGFEIVAQGVEARKFERPVLMVTNHTNYFDWFAPHHILHERLGLHVSSWTKPRPFNSGPLVEAILSRAGNIPMASRGYILVTDHMELFGEPPDAQTYRALRDHIDDGSPLPDEPAYMRLLTTPRRMLGWGFDPRELPYRQSIQATFSAMMQETLSLARRAMRAGQVMHVYPEGLISSQLIPGRIGTMQLALELDADILPVGVSGAREAFINSPRPRPHTRVDLRVGELWRVPREAYPQGFRPFDGPLSEPMRQLLQDHTDQYMEQLNALLTPAYQWMPDGESDGWSGIDRFVPTDEG